MRPFSFAISFLTVIPAFGSRLATDREIAWSQYFFPLVGFIIGGILAGLAYFSHAFSLGMGGDGLIIVVWILLTRGLHLDGLMDTADGLFSNKSREQMLEIMKDSRVGAMGVIALALVLLIKFSFLASMNYPEKLFALLLAPALGRCMLVFTIALFPYARSGPGLGKPFSDSTNLGKVAVVSLITLVGAFIVRSWMGVIIIVVAALFALVMAKWIALKLGGLTGDTYGAICELAEAIFLVAVVFSGALLKLA